MLRGLTHPGAHDRLGFRLRGREVTRLETLVDAAFAFSVTMLALSPDQVPGTYGEMVELFKGIPAFLFSLSMLLMFWNGHVAFSRRYGLDDGVTTFLSCVFIAVMLIYVYPLKFMATIFLAHYIPPLRTDSFASAISGPVRLAMMFGFMSAGFVLLHVVFLLLHAHAARRAGALGLTDHERLVTRCEMGSSLIYIAVGLASIGLALVFRNGVWVVSAGFVYGVLGIALPVYWAVRGPTGEAVLRARAGG